LDQFTPFAKRRVGGDCHLAEEVAQEVFTDLASKSASLSQRKALVGWLFVAARFASAKAVRRDKQRQSLQQKAERMTEHSAHIYADASWEEFRPLLDDAIHELNERDREAILLYFFDKRTFGDIGSKLRITESGARMRVERALEKLRLSLGRRGITSTTAALSVCLGGQAVAAVPGGLAASVTTAALAGAVHPAGLALFYFMTITKTQLAVTLAVVLTGATIVGIMQQQKVTRLLTERKALMLESSANAGRVNDIAGRLAKAEAALAGTRVQTGGAKAAGNSSGPKIAPNSGASGMTVIHMKDLLRDHPEMAALQRKELRRSIIREYSSAIAALNLPPDQATQIKNLLIEKAMSSADAMEAATQAGLQPNSGETNRAISQATKDLDQSINSLIGIEANEKLEGLKSTTFHSGNAIEPVALDMEDAGVALSADQSQALALYLHDLSDPTKNPDASTPGFKEADPSTWQSPLDQQFYAKAAAILTPNQLQILKSSWGEDNQRNSILNQYKASPYDGVMITN
jgi:RNA polymerase sigma factor (sigma-70 family)